MKRILALLLVLFVVGCAPAEDTSSGAETTSDPAVEKVGADTEENTLLSEELSEDLDAVVDDLEGLDW